MAFNTGLSGLRAASVDLDVTGNNIANASTVGFKGSEAQFGDLYANGLLSAGVNPIGNGVWVQDVKQSFGQGNISFTDNGLDMAISGDGFFMLNNGGEIRYSRAGQFAIDKDGYVTNSQAMRVQGYTADSDGNLSGIRDDLQIAAGNLAPRRTTNLGTDLNLDSREPVLETRVRDIGPLPIANLQGDSFSVQYSDGSPDANVAIAPAATARQAAAALSAIRGLSASATTTAVANGITDNAIANANATGSFTFSLDINGAPLALNTNNINSLQDLVDSINNSSETSISASAVEDGAGTNVLRVIHNQGETLNYAFGDGTTTTNPLPVPGDVNVTADRRVASVDDPANGAFETAFNAAPIRITNDFNPLDQRSYNYATSSTIYDSLGNSHELTQFFVKNPAPGNGVGVSQWSVYARIDGEFVGGSDVSPFVARFDQDGALQSINGDPNGQIVIDDWTPKDETGQPNGADGPPAPGATVITPIPEPPTSSSFVIDLSDTTQYGAAFGVNDQQQNGYTTGRLSGLDVSGEGVLFARYTNGQSQARGQVALAAFNNANGLSPAGDTSWVETFESGQPIIGAPDTATLGSIRASSIEESNVDLSAELVNLIIAQRNYQANAKTIETSDAVTQTIINLR